MKVSVLTENRTSKGKFLAELVGCAAKIMEGYIKPKEENK